MGALFLNVAERVSLRTRNLDCSHHPSASRLERPERNIARSHASSWSATDTARSQNTTDESRAPSLSTPT